MVIIAIKEIIICVKNNNKNSKFLAIRNWVAIHTQTLGRCQVLEAVFSQPL